MRRVSSRQRLVSWDAFDATTTSASTLFPPGHDQDHDSDHLHGNDDDDADSASFSDYETCYDTLPPTTPTTTDTTTTLVAAAAKMMMMHRVSSIGSNLSQEDAAFGMSSFLKRKRASRHGKKQLQLVESPPPIVPIDVPMTTLTTNQQDDHNSQVMSALQPPATIIPTFPWEVNVVAQTSSFYSVHEEEDDEQEDASLFVTPPTSPTSSKPTITTFTTTSAAAAHITSLPDDVQVHWLGFLALDDIRSMTQTGRLYHRLILGDYKAQQQQQEQEESTNATAAAAGCNLLWKNLCRQQWPYLNNLNHDHNHLQLVDTLHVGGSTQQQDQPDEDGSSHHDSDSRPNLNLLLRLAASEQSVPTAVDQTLFQPQRWTRTISLRLGGGAGGPAYNNLTVRSNPAAVAAIAAALGQPLDESSLSSSQLQERLAPNGRMAVQFVGTVGTGDRCIRANHPLPRPKLLTRSQLRRIHKCQHKHHNTYGSSLLCQSSTSAIATAATNTMKKVTSTASLSSLSSSSTSSSTTPPTTTTTGGAAASVLCAGGSFMQRLRRTSRRLASSSPYSVYHSSSSSGRIKPVWQPFVAPFYVQSLSSSNKDDEPPAVVSVTPRLVAYFEVSILAAPAVSAQEAEERRRRQQQQRHQQQHPAGGGVAAPWRLPMPATTASSTECVAVGLARGEFSLHTRMPGWDADSYGYHGDDGGIFHNAGHMIRPFGPKFGVGDVVGCGIDYQEQSIFYTLNGTFLGYAFDKIDITTLEQQDLYPVVGMDTNCLVQVNFGTSGQAFQYNLDAKMESHKQVICEALRPIINM